MKLTGETEKKEYLKPTITLKIGRNLLGKIQPFVDEFINQIGKGNVKIEEDIFEVVDIPLG